MREKRELGAVARLALPIITVQMGMMMMGTVDTMMMGRVSADALAAVALGHVVSMTLLLFCQGLLLGLDPLIAQAHGARESSRLSGHVARALVVAGALSLVSWLLMYDVTAPLRWLGQDEAVVPAAASYIRLVAIANPAFLGFVVVRQLLQATGSVWPLLVSIVAANLFNVAADWALVFGNLGFPALGVEGCAIATAVARWGCLLVLLIVANRTLRPCLHGGLAGLRDLAGYTVLFRIGLPVAVHVSLEIGVFSTVGLIINGTWGATAMASHMIALNLASIVFMVPLGLSAAAAARVGCAVGAGDDGGARAAAWTALRLAATFMLSTGLTFALVPRLLARLYTPEDLVVAGAAALIPVAGAFAVFDGLQVVGGGVLRGIADTRVPAAWALVGYWLLGLPAGWALAIGAGMGPSGLWWGLCVGLATVAVALLLRIRRRLSGEIVRVERREMA